MNMIYDTFAMICHIVNISCNIVNIIGVNDGEPVVETIGNYGGPAAKFILSVLQVINSSYYYYDYYYYYYVVNL